MKKLTTFCTFGDSLLAEGGTTTNPSDIYIPVGAAGQNYPYPFGRAIKDVGNGISSQAPHPAGNTVTGYNSRGFVYRAMQTAGWPLRDLGNFGVSGDTTGAAPNNDPAYGMLDRIDHVLRLKPDVIIMGGGKNDYPHSIPPTGYKSSVENLRKIYKKCEDAGVVVIDFTVTPSNATTTDQRIQESIINYFKMDYASHQKGHYCIDISAPFLNQSSLANSYGVHQSAYLRDGLHYNAVGAGIAAQPLADLLMKLFPPLQKSPTLNTIGTAGTLYTESKILNKNPMMVLGAGQAATAPCTGTAPQYWGVYRSGGTIIGDVSVETQKSLSVTHPEIFKYTDAGYATVVDVSAATGTERIYVQGQPTFTPPDLSGPWVLEAEVSAFGTSGCLSTIDLSTYVTTALSENLFGTYANRNVGSDPMALTKFYGKLRTPEFYMPVGVSSAIPVFGISITANSTAQIAIRNPIFRKIENMAE